MIVELDGAICLHKTCIYIRILSRLNSCSVQEEHVSFIFSRLHWSFKFRMFLIRHSKLYKKILHLQIFEFTSFLYRRFLLSCVDWKKIARMIHWTSNFVCVVRRQWIICIKRSLTSWSLKSMTSMLCRLLS